MADFNLTNHFLIAMPAMTDPYFARSLTYICEHTEQGAMGIVVNRPLSLTLKELLGQIKLSLDDPDLADLPVHFGGPVQTDRGFVLHHPVGNWQSSLKVTDSLALTTSKDILQAVSIGQGPEQLLVSLGYAGWEAGQLEKELTENAWLSVLATEHILFDLAADEKLPAALRLLGVDWASLAEEAGHA